MQTKTLLSAAGSSRRSASVGAINGASVRIALSGTMGTATGTLDVSPDGGTTWVPTGFTFSASARVADVDLKDTEIASVNYTAGGSSSWTLTAY